MSMVDKATQFIALKHDGQYRRGLDIPYAMHLFGVARVLKTADYPDYIVIAGLLHDIFEDSDATEQEIGDMFGSHILNIVRAISDPDKTVPWRERKQLAIEKVKQLTDEQVSVAIAEKIQNMTAMTEVIRSKGEEAWFRESASKYDQYWFYENFLKEIKEHHPNNKLLEEFERCIDNLYSIK